MEKSKFKKLASMGMAAGILLASEVPASVNAFEGTVLAGCGGMSAPSNNAYRNQPTYSSCSSRSQPSQGCSGRNQPGQQGCAGRSQQMTAERDQQGQIYQSNPYNQQSNPNMNPNAQQMDPNMNSNIQQRNINTNPNAQINPNTQQRTPGYSAGCAHKAGCGAQNPNSQPNQNYASCNGRSQPNDNNSNRNNNITADASADTKMQNPGMQNAKTLTESELFSQLTSESKAQYQNLDPQGKAMALKLASQFQDKNQAIRVASQRMTERRTLNSNGQRFVAPGSSN